jgi:hypothetical protein
MQALPHGDVPLQQERTDLIDDAGTLTDQSIADAVQRLKVELIGGLGHDELHGRTLEPLNPDARMRKKLTDAAAVGNAAGRALNWRPRESLDWTYYRNSS